MKKILIAFLVLSLVLTGCEEKKEVNNSGNNNINEAEKNDELIENNESTENDNEENTDTQENIKDEPTKEEVKEEPVKPSCTAKKFSNKYSYVYSTKEECVAKGNDAYIHVYENVDSKIFTYGCEEIVDECGTTWYGVYFNKKVEEGVNKVYY